MKITNLKSGVKNPNRVNVFVDDKYSFSLDLTQVVDFKLKIGQEITPEKLAELKSASDFGKLYQRTLEWALIRPRSVRETRDYLRRKDCSKFSNAIISRLQEKGYLNDETFAKYYVENRFVKKGISKKRLRLELIKKGISQDIIDEVLNARNDETEIKKVIAKKRAKYDDDKLISYLVRQGFDYQLAQTLVHSSETD